NHWTLLDTAAEVRPYCCPTASQLEIDADGHTVSHKWFMISGQNQSGDQTGTVEEIEFTDASPRWKTVGSILQPLATTKAVLLPDGRVLIGQGVNRSGNCKRRRRALHLRRKRRSSLPDVRPRDRLHQPRLPDRVGRARDARRGAVDR